MDDDSFKRGTYLINWILARDWGFRVDDINFTVNKGGAVHRTESGSYLSLDVYVLHVYIDDRLNRGDLHKKFKGRVQDVAKKYFSIEYCSVNTTNISRELFAGWHGFTQAFGK